MFKCAISIFKFTRTPYRLESGRHPGWCQMVQVCEEDGEVLAREAAGHERFFIEAPPDR